MKKSQTNLTVPLSIAVAILSGAVSYLAIKNCRLQKQLDRFSPPSDEAAAEGKDNFLGNASTAVSAISDTKEETAVEAVVEKEQTPVTQNELIAFQDETVDQAQPIEKNVVEKVYQYDADFKMIRSYPTLAAAAKAVNIHVAPIRRACLGQQISCSGYFWSKGTRPLRKIPEKWKQRAEKMKQQSSVGEISEN